MTSKPDPPPYAAVEVIFLNRETGKLEGMYCYPVTDIRLISADAEKYADLTVAESGFWRETTRGQSKP